MFSILRNKFKVDGIMVQIQRKKIFQRTFMSRMSPRSPTGLMGMNQPNLGHKIQFGFEPMNRIQFPLWLHKRIREIRRISFIQYTFKTFCSKYTISSSFHPRANLFCLSDMAGGGEMRQKGNCFGKCYHPTNNRIANDRKCDSGEKYFCWNQ